MSCVLSHYYSIFLVTAIFFFFFFNDTATTEIYTLSLHDALPILDLGVVHVEAGGYATGRDGLAQAVQKGVQPLVGIELSVRDEAAGVVERGLEEDLLLASPRALDPRAE